MRLKTYAGFSCLATIAVIYHAFSSREQFYPAMVYLSSSKFCFVLLMNMGLVLMCILWQLVKCLFLGTLREAEVERLNEQAWRELMEILFAITIFRQDLSVSSLGTVTALLLIKSLHWLAQKRVEHIETTPSVRLLSHIRIASFMLFLLVVDCFFVHKNLNSLIETWHASLALFFSFEYTILASTMMATFLKYVFFVTDMLMEGQWEKKDVFTFYLDLIRDLFNLSLYILFFMVIFLSHGVPLHLIRELYETFRSFRNRIADYIRYRKVASNMDERFPDATPEELNASDATCIVCREEMVTAKKLLCGHFFHVHCLRSWLERQNTCPTCRALVVPSENGPGGSGRQHRNAQDNQTGSTAASTSMQNVEGGAAGDYLSPHQARLKAAAAAASVYEKSLIYPARNTFLRSPGHSLAPQIHVSETDNRDTDNELIGGAAASGPLQQASVPEGYPHIVMPAQAPGSSSTYSLNAVDNTNLKMSILKAHEAFIQTQIEILRTELQVLQQNTAEQPDSSRGRADHSEPDAKGKAVIASTASLSDSGGPAGETQEDIDTNTTEHNHR